MNEVLACFHNIVTNVANSARLPEECDILALRIAKVVKGNVNLGEYKSCMLASLRSLLPKDWDSAHEIAWVWLWEMVEQLILKIHGSPPVWEKAIQKTIESLTEDAAYALREDVYRRFFLLKPEGQDHFRCTVTYMHYVAERVTMMMLEFFQNPVQTVEDISALGLRHVGYQIPPALFGPFISSYLEAVKALTEEDAVLKGIWWILSLISGMLMRTIAQGSTIVMKAINTNSRKLLVKAIACAARGERCDWMLTVQVGTQKNL